MRTLTCLSTSIISKVSAALRSPSIERASLLNRARPEMTVMYARASVSGTASKKTNCTLLVLGHPDHRRRTTAQGKTSRLQTFHQSVRQSPAGLSGRAAKKFAVERRMIKGKQVRHTPFALQGRAQFLNHSGRVLRTQRRNDQPRTRIVRQRE